MPCNFGVIGSTRTVIPNVQPQEIEEEVAPLEVDSDLLEKIGEEDQLFLEWLNELDERPLVEEALRRAMLKAEGSDTLTAYIGGNGFLVVKGSYRSVKDKRQVEEVIKILSARFQMEIVAITAELLDYRVSLKQGGRAGEVGFVIEGEKESATGVAKYLRVSKSASGDGSLVFEHFESQKSVFGEQNKFLGLAQKLGVKISTDDTEYSGQALPETATHEEFLREER